MGIVSSEYKLQDKTVIIRNAEIQDAQNIIDFVNLIDEESLFLAREPGEFTVQREKEEQLIEGWKASDHDIFTVAIVDDEVAGICGLHGNGRKRYVHKAGISIAVKKKYWGLGIGRRLMECAINWGKEKGLKRIELEVDTENSRAITLYMNLGFHIEGRQVRDRRMVDGTYRDGYSMGLLID